MGRVDARKVWEQEWQAHFNIAGEWFSPPNNRLTHVGDNNSAALQKPLLRFQGQSRRRKTPSDTFSGITVTACALSQYSQEMLHLPSTLIIRMTRVANV